MKNWRGVDLTLVLALVFEPDIIDDQLPVLELGVFVHHPKSRVLDVLVLADAYQAHVVMANPRDLWRTTRGEISIR